MVLTRTMTAKRKPLPLPLPHDMVVQIAAHIAATSPHPMQDICSLRATCQATHAACKEGVVRSSVALEREESMRWFDHERYLALVRNLAAAGNPEACFVHGLTLVFAQRRMGLGTEWLRRAAAAGHKVTAYALGVLRYGDKEAERYIRQVESEDEVSHGSKANRTNRECLRSRAQAVEAVSKVTWKVDGMMGTVLVPPPAEEGIQGCKGNGCGVPEGWDSGGCAVFCSEGCRLRHEYSEYFSRVSSHVTSLIRNTS